MIDHPFQPGTKVAIRLPVSRWSNGEPTRWIFRTVAKLYKNGNLVMAGDDMKGIQWRGHATSPTYEGGHPYANPTGIHTLRMTAFLFDDLGLTAEAANQRHDVWKRFKAAQAKVETLKFDDRMTENLVDLLEHAANAAAAKATPP